MKILVMNGPNLNFLGIREKNIYGTQNYDALVKMIREKAAQTGCEIAGLNANRPVILSHWKPERAFISVHEDIAL